MTTETWATIPGLGGHQVSDHGQLRRPDGHIVPQHLVSGYLRCSLKINGKGKNVRVHRAMLLAFKGPPPPDKPLACHEDGKRTHNRLDNLRWDSPRANQMDRNEHGTGVRGAANYHTVLTEDYVRGIRAALSIGFKQVDLAEFFGITRANVSAIKHRKSWAYL